MRRNTFNWVRLIVIMVWALLSFILLAGEEAPDAEPMSMGQFILIKVVGVVSLLSCVLVGKFLNRKGLLPNMEDVD